jgi:hypothetical protein
MESFYKKYVKHPIHQAGKSTLKPDNGNIPPGKEERPPWMVGKADSAPGDIFGSHIKESG